MVEPNVWRWVLDIGWLSFLLYLFHHFWQARRTLVQAKSWLKAKGRVILCEWTQTDHNAWPKIEYSYQVSDQELIGEYLFLDTSHNSPNSRYARLIAYKATMAFNEQSDIDVYYNPNHPEQSALDVSIPVKLNIILTLIGLFILLHLGVMMWRWFF